ncbi:putrescine-ornithine antiporter [Neoactinobaculum massilliense]|uniref:putrescine-ornithine antiporter n=1 Tax=Neoactinobaculum massilliense TaxID=2364794 RepID=UPI0019D062E3|nr:putrescine-ornithine antiporter [Neoactinobaculum massilliense]
MDAVSEPQPAKKKMTVVQLTVVTMINMMGSGIIMLPTQLAKVGTISILSWVVTAGGATLLAYAFARLGRYSKKEGGMGGYSEYAFGKSGNFLANFAYFVSLIIANIAIAVSAVGYALSLADVDTGKIANGPLIVGVLAIATLWLATVLNFGGARITGRLSTVTIWGVIIPVVGISIIGWFWFDPQMWAHAWNPHHLDSFTAISSSISMTLWAFLGIESASANSDSVENPERNVPIAVMGGCIGAAVLYVLSTNVMFGITGYQELANSNGPFGLVFSEMLNPVAGKFVLVLMVISCFGSLLAWQFTIAQVARSLARAKMMPHLFTKETKAGAPIAGMVTITVIQSLLSLMTISPTLSKQFEVLVNLAVITNVVPYILCMASVMIVQRRAHVPAHEARVVNIIATVAGIYSLYAMYTAGESAMMGGALVTFFGWLVFGWIAPRLEKQREVGKAAVPEVTS